VRSGCPELGNSWKGSFLHLAQKPFTLGSKCQLKSYRKMHVAVHTKETASLCHLPFSRYGHDPDDGNGHLQIIQKQFTLGQLCQKTSYRNMNVEVQVQQTASLYHLPFWRYGHDPDDRNGHL